MYIIWIIAGGLVAGFVSWLVLKDWPKKDNDDQDRDDSEDEQNWYLDQR